MNNPNPASEPGIVELRRYVMQPRQRDVFIEHFERHFIEPLETAGMCVLGQFRDMHHPDLCIWMRGFSDMSVRKRSLETFYGSALWAVNRNAVNATLIDSDDVFLLRPAWPGSSLPAPASARAGVDSTRIPAGVLVVSIHFLKHRADAALLRCCREQVSDVMINAGVRSLGWYVTETSENDFPRLPVRSGEHVLVNLALLPDIAIWKDFESRDVSAHDVAPLLEPWLAAASEVHHLLPTVRSALHA